MLSPCLDVATRVGDGGEGWGGDLQNMMEKKWSGANVTVSK